MIFFVPTNKQVHYLFYLLSKQKYLIKPVLKGRRIKDLSDEEISKAIYWLEKRIEEGSTDDDYDHDHEDDVYEDYEDNRTHGEGDDDDDAWSWEDWEDWKEQNENSEVDDYDEDGVLYDDY